MFIVNKKNNHNSSLLVLDIFAVVLSIAVAIFLLKTEVLVKILTSTAELEWVGSFMAGMFFTSIFTATPAIVTLGAIAQANSALYTAFYGAMGAVIGDVIILNFFRDHLSLYIMEMLNYKELSKRAHFLLRSSFFKWLPAFLGGLIMASPLPDELGIALLEISKVKPRMFVLFSFVFNFVGIYLIGLVAQSL